VFSSTWGLSFMGKPPKPKEPWEIREPSPRGDPNPNLLFESIGRALTEWETVEGACAELFALFVLAPKRKPLHAPAVRAYGAVVSYQGRCAMIRAASDAYFQTRKDKKSAFQAKLKELIDRCLDYSNRRNEIAHGRVCVLYGYPVRKDTGKGKEIGYYLFPSFFNPKKYGLDMEVTYRYTSSDVIHYQQEFTKLFFRLHALRSQLNRHAPQALREKHG
jgi:hypothetical protein